MKKKLILPLVFLLLFSSCSVQEKMSPEIFMERLEKNFDRFEYENAEKYYENNNYVCYLNSDSADEFMIEIITDTNNNAVKICFAAFETDNGDEFVSAAQAIIKSFSANDDGAAVCKELFEKNGSSNDFSYYETQWYRYCASFIDSVIYFSAESKKLSPESEYELTLKQNDNKMITT